MQTNHYQAELARGHKKQMTYWVAVLAELPLSTPTSWMQLKRFMMLTRNNARSSFVPRTRVGGGEASVIIASTSMVSVEK